MATKGCCSNTGCSCVIKAGAGIIVRGSGSTLDPYRIENGAAALSDTLQIQDTPTLNLRVVGTGREGDPMIISGDATVKVEQLADIDDPMGPVPGDVLTRVADGNGGHWEFRPPPPTPAGAVNATNGIIGIGSSETPLEVAVSGVWGQGPLAGAGSDSTVGLATYIDSAGQLRVEPPQETTVTWGGITGKPTTFPPSAHTHTWDQITEKPTVFPVSMGGTGGTTKATARNGIGVYVQSGTPSGASTNDLWFW